MEPFLIDDGMAALLSDLDDEELRGFVQADEGPQNDEQIEQHIYVCFLCFTRTNMLEHLEEATQRAEGWVAVTDADNPDRPRRFQILDMLTARATMQSTNDGILSPEAATVALNSLSESTRLAQRHQETGDIEDLNGAITMMERAVGIMGHLQQSSSLLAELGTMLYKRFKQAFCPDDINRAIEVVTTALDRTAEGHPDRGGWLNKMGAMFIARFEETRLNDDLNRAIETTSLALDTNYSKVSVLSNLGLYLKLRFNITGSIDDLNRAIEFAELAVGATLQSDPERAHVLESLGNILETSFDQTESMGDLNRAIEVTNMAVDTMPEHHRSQATCLAKLGDQLEKRFHKTSSMDDLDRAIEFTNMAVDAAPQDDSNRVEYLDKLGNRLGIRFFRTGSIDDVNRAIQAADSALRIAPPDHPRRVDYLNKLGNRLDDRFDQTGSMDDLNRAIEAMNSALEITPPGDPTNRAILLHNLGQFLSSRFEQTGLIADLNHAIDVCKIAVDLTPQWSPSQTLYLASLGYRLGMRFEQTGSMDDLNRALEITNTAFDNTPQDPSDRIGVLDTLQFLLGLRSGRTGSVVDVDNAIKFATMAVNATPQGHQKRRALLTNLSSKLGMRFQRTGSMDDLNAAIDFSNMAVDATPKNHYQKFDYLNGLGLLLGRRFQRTQSIHDLNRAIDITTLAVDTTPQGSPFRGKYLTNLGGWLSHRFMVTRQMDDLDRAINVTQTAADIISHDEPMRFINLNNLGALFKLRFDRTQSMDDLNHAIEVWNTGLTILPHDHPMRSVYLTNVGRSLEDRFRRTESVEDAVEALLRFEEGWGCKTSPPSDRIISARRAANILASRRDWANASILLQEAVELLPTVSPRTSKHTDKQHKLASFGGIASLAAAMALSAGKDVYDALRLLELGRGITSGLLMDLRSDISDLQEKHQDLANEFILLRDELDSPADGPTLTNPETVAAQELQASRRRDVDKKFGDLLLRIRSKRNFQNFLLPPTREELMAAATPNPIAILNVSPYRCDAFLIERDAIRVVNLPALTQSEAEGHVQNLRSSRAAAVASSQSVSLEWLWNVVARPVLDELGFKNAVTDVNWPRIWWVPTGPLSQLPLHAAGLYSQGSTETVLDRVMSSYTSSVKALVRGRRQRRSELPLQEQPEAGCCEGDTETTNNTSPSTETTNDAHTSSRPTRDTAVLVAMEKTPGLGANGSLPFAGAEVEILREKFCPGLGVQPETPRGRKEDVLRDLPTCKIFHFAGHGRSDPMDPSQSCLLLEDWETNPLTVGNLLDSRLQDNAPFLAYLSACSTGANQVESLADEGIHLVSAFQLAGFRHVVGTLWEVSDMHCVNVAEVLYGTMVNKGMTDTAVCLGLHLAVRALRDGKIPSEAIKDGEEKDGGEGGEAEGGAIQGETESRVMEGETESGETEGKEGEAAKTKSREARTGEREPRDGTLLDDESDKHSERDFRWVPFVHYGV
ncbi:CHAT domain-containing protein [Cladorrhinum sp. PSN259]|nr:CHAT domain-containing protein [Cladorrhinum sp. PSN259]